MTVERKAEEKKTTFVLSFLIFWRRANPGSSRSMEHSDDHLDAYQAQIARDLKVNIDDVKMVRTNYEWEFIVRLDSYLKAKQV